jgi:hypothetical protein
MTYQDCDSPEENTAHSTLISLILHASSMKRLISSSILCELSVSYFTRSVLLFQSLFLAGFKRGLSFRGRITKNGNPLRVLITGISHPLNTRLSIPARGKVVEWQRGTTLCKGSILPPLTLNGAFGKFVDENHSR